MDELDGKVSARISGPLLPDYYTVSELVERWGATKDDIRRWCREKYIPGSYLSGNAYRIPANAMRPLDEKLAKEILWQLLENRGSSDKLDLSDRGVGDAIPEYLEALKAKEYIKCKNSNIYHLNRKGFKLLGRYDDRGKDKEAFETMAFVKSAISAAGSVAGAIAARTIAAAATS